MGHKHRTRTPHYFSAPWTELHMPAQNSTTKNWHSYLLGIMSVPHLDVQYRACREVLPNRGSNCLIWTSSTQSAGNQPVLPLTVPSQKPPSPILSTDRKIKKTEIKISKYVTKQAFIHSVWSSRDCNVERNSTKDQYQSTCLVFYVLGWSRQQSVYGGKQEEEVKQGRKHWRALCTNAPQALVLVTIQYSTFNCLIH